MAIGVFAFAGLCFFGTLMLVENSTELLAQTVLPVREPRMAWGKNNPVGEAKGIYPGRWYGLMHRCRYMGERETVLV